VIARGTTILQVGTSDVGGGAERVMMDLHAEYLERGSDSWVAVGRKRGDAERVLQIPGEEARNPWARRLSDWSRSVAKTSARRGDAAWLAERALLLASEPARWARVFSGMEDFGYPGTASILRLPPSRPDVLHLHNLHGYYFDLRMLPHLSASQPTIVTMHDAWLLTGHCAQPLDCERWVTGCGECPYLDLYVPMGRDASARDRRLKGAVLGKSHIGLAMPSNWLLSVVERSGLAEPALGWRVIPNGVDTGVFRPADKAAARVRLGLPEDRAIVLFAAGDVATNPFKDYGTLAEALPIAAASLERPLQLVALGGSAHGDVTPSTETRFVPFTSDPSEVATYYQAADLYVHASRAESFGLSVAEAMACGTPVVASRVGGIPEVVADGETGALVEPGDAAGMAAAVAALLDRDDVLRTFGEAAARRVLDRFTIERQADAYLAWYSELLDTGSAGAQVHSDNSRFERPHV
jgi:glycosyltransferase involved in cell wall biosynthesis